MVRPFSLVLGKSNVWEQTGPMTQQIYNLADPDFLIDPTPMLARMRADGPIVRIKLPIVGKIWVTTTHAATTKVAKGKDNFFLTGHGAGLKKKGNASLPWWAPASLRAMADNMLGKDDPEHRRLRKLVDQAFARRGIRDMRPNIARIAATSVAGLGEGTTNIVPDFCRAFPLEVIAELLGVADDDRDSFARMGKALGDLGGFLSIIRLLWVVKQFQKLVRRIVADMRANPQPGLITDLIAAEEQGDQLSEDELVSMVFLLMFAGFETTTNLLAGAIVALDNHPDRKAWLLADFDNRIETATEELCRFVTSVTATKPRIAARDVDIDGAIIAKGEKVMALPVAANFDPAVFEAPEQLRLDRFPNPHLAFSTGAHFCLGMQLVRVELQEGLRALYAAHPQFSVNNVVFATRPGHRAVTTLDVDLG